MAIIEQSVNSFGVFVRDMERKKQIEEQFKESVEYMKSLKLDG